MRRVVLALFLLACSTPRGEVTSKTRGAIQGGSSDATSSFAVAIVDKTGGICSGTLIAPNLVLTARHCVADSGGDLVDCATDEFESPRAASAFKVTTAATADYDTAEHSVTKIFVPNDMLFCGNDIALVMIDGNESGKVAEPMFDVPDLDAITAIGYGTTGTYESDDGKRRKLSSVDVECVPGLPARDCDLSSYQMTKTELAAGAGLCAGDSGSGAFVPSSLTTKPMVIGVLSRAGEDGDACIDAIYTRTDGFKKLLVDAAKEASTTGGYPLPAWAGGTSTPTPDPTPGEGEPTDEPAPNPDEPVGTEPPPATTTTTEGGCAAAPGKSHDLWPFALVALAFIKRRRRSH